MQQIEDQVDGGLLALQWRGGVEGIEGILLRVDHVAAAIIETLDSLHLRVSELSPEGRAQLDAVRALLEKD
ncbi:hypothetical protein L107_00490 [Cyanobium sp. Copco_Reservoir_LC18]|nr:hypothetical protein L107_00490 [Cyanobium sp. Copco_Reservoir_LC18]